MHLSCHFTSILLKEKWSLLRSRKQLSKSPLVLTDSTERKLLPLWSDENDTGSREQLVALAQQTSSRVGATPGEEQKQHIVWEALGKQETHAIVMHAICDSSNPNRIFFQPK